ICGARRSHRRLPTHRQLRMARPQAPDTRTRTRRRRRRDPAVGIALAFRSSHDSTNPAAVMVPVFAVYLGAFILVPTTIPMAARAAAALLARLSPTSGRLAADSLRANPRRTTINVMALFIPVATVALTAV